MIINKSLKASYTVEATVVISLCLILFSSAVVLSYEIFKETLDYVAYKPSAFDPVKTFRTKEGIVGIFNAIRD
ncbi:hypothetical protein SAMN02910298_01804 [Pseudobutyrivibrio sp. YE44]|uniref:hypothetical protein n=1 Tax=Pseudobutyrivibrio sp. YE44 TaxID=1520802 RepID=UPI000891D697|nr:hypothetical protein [Pseudobutyrivibrio sp. YE44]SDB37312.1 hypothetical protein SAMN02910298_01804 [Pseudobutyrivibrio sp. YE44]